MSENEYAAAVSEFLRKRAITHCPTGCVVASHGQVTEADRVALRRYHTAREAARVERLTRYRQTIAG